VLVGYSEVREGKKGRWGVSQSQFPGSLIEIPCAVTCATGGAKATIADALDQSLAQVARVSGEERMDLQYSEVGGKFHFVVRVFLRHLA
jgi:hypothetical protein